MFRLEERTIQLINLELWKQAGALNGENLSNQQIYVDGGEYINSGAQKKVLKHAGMSF